MTGCWVVVGTTVGVAGIPMGASSGGVDVDVRTGVVVVVRVDVFGSDDGTGVSTTVVVRADVDVRAGTLVDG